VWRESKGPAAVEFVRLPLDGVTKVEASSRPGAELRARVGDETYGPAIAGKNGQAIIPVLIAPGTRDLVLLAKTGGVVTERTVAVETPPYNRLAAVVTPSALSPGFSGTARLDVLYDVNGPVDPAVVHARASAGTLALESADGPRLRYRWELRGVTPGEVTFTVAADGDPASSASVALRPVAETGFALRVGVRAGVTHSLASLVGPRYGLDGWATFNPGGIPLGLGLTAAYGSADQVIIGPPSQQLTRAAVNMLPLSLRLGFVPVRAGGATLLAGAGFTATITRFQTFITQDGPAQEELWRVGPSAMLFAGGTWNLGPGQAFGEVVLSWAAVEDPGFRVQAGGLGLEVGYRFDVLRR